MRIAIDVRLMYGKKGGIGVNLANLVNKLKEIDKTNEYLFFYEKIEEKRCRSKCYDFLIPFLIDYFHKQFILPFILHSKKVDILFCPQQPIPFFFFKNTVVNIHDVPQDFEVKSPVSWIIRHIIFPLTAKRARLIITDSNFSKKRIIDKLGVPAAKVRVIYFGLDQSKPDFESNTESAVNQIKKRYNLKKIVILSVLSSLSPRKNVQTLIKAFDHLPTKLKVNSSLLIMGKSEGWTEIREKIKGEIDLTTSDSIVLTGFVPHHKLTPYYKLADVFVFPSLHEGFGLPVLEAMAYGVPIICSNAASLPEVYGDAGIGVDPMDALSFAKNIEMLLSNDELKRKLQGKSLERAKFFNIEKQALNLLEALRSIKTSRSISINE